MRILVVEDDVKMAELLRRGLTAAGHSVQTALDGITGLETAQSGIFDVIVLDIMQSCFQAWTGSRLHGVYARIACVFPYSC